MLFSQKLFAPILGQHFKLERVATSEVPPQGSPLSIAILCGTFGSNRIACIKINL